MSKTAHLLFLVGILFIFFIGRQVIQANEIDDRISQLQAKIIELQGTEDSLSRQINLLNSQISLTTLRIENTTAAIKKLENEVNELIDEIDKLEDQLTVRSALVLKRVNESYKRHAAPRFGILMFSNNFSDFVSRLKYIAQVQEDDVQLLVQLKATQQYFTQRKELREEKRVQQEKLKVDLEKETQELKRQKLSKQALLVQTRSSEAVYQQLLANAFAERQALEQALVDSVKVGEVKRGDPIALVGNTGYPNCSTGAHLHFEIRKNNAWTDPGAYLSKKSVVDEQNGASGEFGNGSWDWPVQDTIRLTQHYGRTPYSWRYAYSGGIHTGYDIISTASSIIRAPRDGTLYSSSQNCGSSIIKIKYIDHGDGVISFYLHVQ